MMSTPQRRLQRYRISLYAGIGMSWLVYLALLLIGPNHQGSIFDFGLSLSMIVRISFAVPVLLVWLIAARAVVGFRRYANLIHDSREALGVRLISKSLFFLLVYLVMILLLGRISNLFYGTTYLTPIIFIKNHVPVYTLLIAFLYLYRGSTHVISQLNISVPPRRLTIVWVLFFLFSLGYSMIFLSQPELPVSLAGTIPAFAVSSSTLIFTMVLPSLMSWILGIIACMNLSALSSKIKGIIYREALRYLITGLYASIIFAVLVEIIVFNSAFIARFGTVSVLLVIYLFVVAYGIGYAYIDRGARRLALIELVGRA
jgi:hypothetical protein